MVNTQGCLHTFCIIIQIIQVVQCTISYEDDLNFYKSVSDNKRKNETKAPAPKGLSFASYFGDHMVLQRGPQKAGLWGYADLSDLGKTVNVNVIANDRSYSKAYQVTVRKGPFPDHAVWSLQLAAMTHPGPYTIAASLGKQVAQIVDVLFGDVWLCSGQSNMQFTVKMMFRAKDELAKAGDFPHIRLFTVALTSSKVPQYDLMKVTEKWSVASNVSLGGGYWYYMSAVCWMFGKNIHTSRGYPIGLVATSFGGTAIQYWSSPEALNACRPHQEGPRSPRPHLGLQGPSSLWNAMIYPFLNMTIYGAIWYQGEANSVHGRSTYNCSFVEMIQDWRVRFNSGSLGQTSSSFPFGFVQLAPNAKAASLPGKSGFPDIRWHQTADQGFVPNKYLPDVFMAVAVDLPDFASKWGPIHPRDKTTVGWRLALSGLAIAYKVPNIRFQGPQVSTYQVNKALKTLTLELDGGTQPINVRSRVGFEVCCANGTSQTSCPKRGALWVEVPLVSWTQGEVVLDFRACAKYQAVGVRYLWAETPCLYAKMCPIYSIHNELPMAPLVKTELVADGNIHKVTWGQLGIQK